MTMRAIFRLGAGAAIALALALASTPSAHAQAQPASVPPKTAAVPSPLLPDVAFGRFIALIRGHLLTGDELVGAKQWWAAASHFSYPREEIYGVIRADLANYRTPPFDAALKTLVAAVKAQNTKQYLAARQKVEAALAAADAALKERTPDWPRFVVKVAVEVLKVAPDEYEDAVVKGRIVRPIGYQTARGFILQADRMVESVGSEFAGEKAATVGDLRAEFAQLKQAFAPVTAPKQAVIESPSMTAIISRVETTAGKLM